MRRCVVLLLLLAMTCLGTGVAGWAHVALDHRHPDPASASVGCRIDAHADADGGPEAGHCPVCLGLHAPAAVSAGVAVEARMASAIDRVLALQAQRIDASVPAPRGCRGPPVV